MGPDQALLIVNLTLPLTGMNLGRQPSKPQFADQWDGHNNPTHSGGMLQRFNLHSAWHIEDAQEMLVNFAPDLQPALWFPFLLFSMLPRSPARPILAFSVGSECHLDPPQWEIVVLESALPLSPSPRPEDCSVEPCPPGGFNKEYWICGAANTGVLPEHETSTCGWL